MNLLRSISSSLIIAIGIYRRTRSSTSTINSKESVCSDLIESAVTTVSILDILGNVREIC